MVDMTYNISLYRGDTYISPDWYFTEDKVPASITIDEFLDKIVDGTYTLTDLTQYTIRSHVRNKDMDITIDLTPYLNIDNNILSIIIPAEEAAKLNPEVGSRYDIEFTDPISGLVKTVIGGGFTTAQDYTYDLPTGAML